MKHEDVSEGILEAYYRVYNTLGYGFLENVYENALFIELEKMKLPVKAQSPIQVLYEGHVVGKYFADLLVCDSIIVEIKAARTLCLEHIAQLLNYLRATNIETGLLLNFGVKPEIRRRVFDNSRK